MAIFNLDIERFILAQKELGKDLRGIACIQYPIYCLHAEIEDISPDPLDSLDSSIAKIYDSVTTNHVAISSFLSVPASGVKARIRHFEENDYINENKTGLSQYGYNSLITCEEKKVKRKSHDFYIDGISFNPMSDVFYSRKYKQVTVDEMGFTFYTDNTGNVRSYNAFSPSIVHTPFDKDEALKIILSTSEEDRKSLNIPLGLQSIEKINFVKMTFPILIGLFEKDGKASKEIFDGFNSLGESEHLETIKKSILSRVENIELRLNIKRDNHSNEFYDFDFSSNWNEIDIINEENKLFWVSKEDLKSALENHYSISDIPIESIINSENEIGINVTKSILTKATNKRDLINNMRRGRDYQMTNKFLRTGVWVTFFSFHSADEYCSELLELLEFIDSAKSMSFEIEQYVQKFSQYKEYREMLIFIEEYELLEELDMSLNMIQILQNEQ
jgi:hypothetical protein